jgi:hypothetical protein
MTEDHDHDREEVPGRPAVSPKNTRGSKAAKRASAPS